MMNELKDLVRVIGDVKTFISAGLQLLKTISMDIKDQKREIQAIKLLMEEKWQK